MIPLTSPHGVLLVNGLPRGARVHLRVHRAAVGGLEREGTRARGVRQHQPAGGHGQRLALRRQRDPERAVRVRVDAPIRVRARTGSGLDQVQRIGGHEVAVASVEEVAAERCRLHPEALGLAGGGRRRAVAAGRLDHEAARGRRTQRVAPVGEGVAPVGAGGGRQRAGGRRLGRGRRRAYPDVRRLAVSLSARPEQSEREQRKERENGEEAAIHRGIVAPALAAMRRLPGPQQTGVSSRLTLLLLPSLDSGTTLV